MATVLQIKRGSQAGTTQPSSLAAGELAVSYGTGTSAQLQGNNGQRIFVGNHDGSGIQVVGGKYFADKLDHVDGTLTADSAITTDTNSSVDTLKIGNHNANAPEFKLMEATANGTSAIIFKGQAALAAD